MGTCANRYYLAEHEGRFARTESASESLSVRTEQELQHLGKTLRGNFTAARAFLRKLERANEIDVVNEAQKMGMFNPEFDLDYLNLIALKIAMNPDSIPCVVKHARKLAKEALQNV